MPIVLSDNQLQINYNATSLPNAGVRVFNLGSTIPGNNIYTNIIKFTHNGVAGTGLSIKWYFGAGRQSGTLAENWWKITYGLFVSTTTGWSENGFGHLYWEGNAIVNNGFSNSGNQLGLQVQQGDTGAYVESYVEVYSSFWDRITISY